MNSKRGLDLAVAIVFLPLIGLISGFVAILVWATLGRPILFRQERIGLGEKPFSIIKFRTMVDCAGASGVWISERDRIGGVGAFLRRTSLDELPEVVNVLRGEMSLVGPRPLLPEYLKVYTARERIRHSILPGMTGLAQVMGRNCLDWDERLAKDIEYVEKQSFLFDLYILARTVLVVVSGYGVNDRTGCPMKSLTEFRSPKSTTSERP